ncbi:hypothetical protein ACA910_004930 [Epithemia clementina (nom. ined.)]
MDRLYRFLAQIFIFIVSFSYLWICPHSKVEESFSLQAVHDLFYYGIHPGLLSHLPAFGKWNDNSTETATTTIELPPYDHLQFPGVVPRSFVGPLLLATSCQLIRWILSPILDMAEHPLLVQFVARLVLLFSFLQGWFRLARSIDQRIHGSTTTTTTTATSRRRCSCSRVGTLLLIITACQFHLPFYGSRMLPNIFATVGCLHAISAWIANRIPEAAVVLVVTTAVFRCDVILLLFTAGLSWIFVQQKLTIGQALVIGVTSGAVALLLTVPLDSALWQRLVWPEGEVLFFNTILNKSSEWGVSAWHFYLSSSLPKAMFLTLALVPLAIVRVPEQLAVLERRLLNKNSNEQTSIISGIGFLDGKWSVILLPALGYVFLYSFLGHKETRFLFPVMPLFNLAAAIGLDRVILVAFPEKDKRPSMLARLSLVACIMALLLTWLASLCFVAVSRSNYPGGDALLELPNHVIPKPYVAFSSHHVDEKEFKATATVYIGVAAAMSGVSLFGQRAATLAGQKNGVVIVFEKAGYEEDNAIPLNDLLISSSSAAFARFTHLLTEDETIGGDNFRTVLAVQGHPWLNWRRARIQTSNALYFREMIERLEENKEQVDAT